MLSTEEVLIRLLVAALLGSFVGFERERRSAWAAGLRTHMPSVPLPSRKQGTYVGTYPIRPEPT